VDDAGADVGGESSGEEQDEPDRGGDPERPQAQQSVQEPGRPGAFEAASGSSQDRGTPTSVMLARTNLACARSAPVAHTLAKMVTTVVIR
jgi:hypothetical protein